METATIEQKRSEWLIKQAQEIAEMRKENRSLSDDNAMLKRMLSKIMRETGSVLVMTLSELRDNHAPDFNIEGNLGGDMIVRLR